MKKLYVLALSSLFMAGAFAQTKSASVSNNITSATISSRAAAGDTIVYVPLTAIFANTVNQANLSPTWYSTYDLDGEAPSSTLAGAGFADSDAGIFFSTDPTDLTAFDPTIYTNDTSFYNFSFSWLANATAVTDNWIVMGPITLPSAGAILKWRYRCPDQNYCDGFRVYAGTVGGNPASDFGPSELVYTKANGPLNSPISTAGTDTVWNYYSQALPGSLGGQDIYVGFQHTATDLFFVYLDEYLLVEGNASINNENFEGFGLGSINPNPVSEYALINYSVGKEVNVSFTITDINGKVVSVQTEGNRPKGNYIYNMNAQGLNSGVYFVTINAGSYKSTQKMVVAK